jgi:hypothetical protein
LTEGYWIRSLVLDRFMFLKPVFIYFHHFLKKMEIEEICLSNIKIGTPNYDWNHSRVWLLRTLFLEGTESTYSLTLALQATRFIQGAMQPAASIQNGLQCPLPPLPFKLPRYHWDRWHCQRSGNGLQAGKKEEAWEIIIPCTPVCSVE